MFEHHGDVFCHVLEIEPEIIVSNRSDQRESYQPFVVNEVLVRTAMLEFVKVMCGNYLSIKSHMACPCETKS